MTESDQRADDRKALEFAAAQTAVRPGRTDLPPRRPKTVIKQSTPPAPAPEAPMPTENETAARVSEPETAVPPTPPATPEAKQTKAPAKQRKASAERSAFVGERYGKSWRIQVSLNATAEQLLRQHCVGMAAAMGYEDSTVSLGSAAMDVVEQNHEWLIKNHSAAPQRSTFATSFGRRARAPRSLKGQARGKVAIVVTDGESKAMKSLGDKIEMSASMIVELSILRILGPAVT